ncbi:MAG TPA: peptide-methionine (S)-S-oxide reductase MsrA [Ktedonobacterales bacterium]|jgi:peptide-methionine (S)-S-oxide reductase|nr:peptide-methionine (S)-S-oxide reductase MsrA [Ktedonobacterales bacterium]
MSDETDTTTTAQTAQASAQAPGLETATLGGGCFWCLEPIFENLRGVVSVKPGYAGGHVANPSYQQVCSGRTGHAEVAQIVFDPNEVSYSDLLHVFFATHDPTTLNRQGADVGEQYRSVILPHSDEQRRVAEQVIGELTEQRLYDHPIVTTIEPYTVFYPAEDYHQNYFVNHPEAPYCSVVIAPKVAKFRQKYADRLKR